MADDQNQDITPSQEAPQSPSEPTIEPPIQPTDPSPTDMPPMAPEAPRYTFTAVPVEDQNGANKGENQV